MPANADDTTHISRVLSLDGGAQPRATTLARIDGVLEQLDAVVSANSHELPQTHRVAA